jgi:hypothetical protein
MAVASRGVDPTTRRGLLGWLACGTVLTAGCSTVESEGPPDGTIHCYNRTNFPQTVRVQVATASGDQRLDGTFDVPAGERRTSAVVMEQAGDFEVVATTGEKDRSSRTLSFPPVDGEDGGIRGYVRVAISRDGVLVSRAGLT